MALLTDVDTGSYFEVGGVGGGWVQGKFFWRIRFELGETFGEVLKFPTVSEPRPAQIWEPEIAIWPRWS